MLNTALRRVAMIADDLNRLPCKMLRLGFACAWDPDEPSTWSYTPWNLREELRRRADVIDVGIKLQDPLRFSLRALYARVHEGRLVSAWKHSGLWSAICGQTIRRKVERSNVDAVLEIQDLTCLDVPFFLYQDASYDVVLNLWDVGARVAHFPMLDLDIVRRRRERQHRIYAHATGVLAMSTWFAKTLIDWTGMPSNKVFVVQPGANVPGSSAIRVRPAKVRRNLLLVGKDFHTKGGDLVLAALSILRREYDPQITLTIAGPKHWPVGGEPPAGVNFLGRVPKEIVARLYETHDLLVMPSRFEGFGIAFAEALARGLPCIGRNAFAMPELITPGLNGNLVSHDDPDDLARVIASTLADDHIYRHCYDRAPEVAAYFTWNRAAIEVLAAIQGRLPPTLAVPAQ